MQHPAARVLLFLLWTALACVGLWGLWMRLATGHQAAGYGNYVPWGLWVAFYIYFIGMSAGIFILSLVVYVGKVKVLAPLGPLALFTAGVTLIMALASIAADLGHMNRAGQVMLHGSRVGWVRAAHGGTLFLDEVGELTPAAQSRLLRVLETRTVLPVGSDRPVAVDVRFVAATNRDLRAEVAQGLFREDLLYRLAAFELHVPPLRERREDIEPLARGFLAALRERMEEAPKDLSGPALLALEAWRWPGNVRELRNAMDHAAVLAGSATVRVEHLPQALRGESSAPPRWTSGRPWPGWRPGRSGAPSPSPREAGTRPPSCSASRESTCGS